MKKGQRSRVAALSPLCYAELSYGLLDVPHEGAEAEQGGFEVEGVEGFEQRVHAVVVDDGEHGAAQGRPCVAAVVGLTAVGAAAVQLGEEAETAAVLVIEQGEESLLEGLVVSYEDAFHCLLGVFLH